MNQLQIEILRHIYTFRMSTPKAVTNLYTRDLPLATDLLNELARLKFVSSAKLAAGENYYHLLPKAAEPLHLPSVDGRPINGPPKVEAYGKLYFCCMQKTYRPLIHLDTFRTRFKTLFRDGPKVHYYTEGRKLGYIRVDTEANTGGSPVRVLERCATDIDRRRRLYLKEQKTHQVFPEFDAFIASGNFVVALLTPFPQKAHRLRVELKAMAERHSLYQISERKYRENERKIKRGEKDFERINTDIYKDLMKWKKRGHPPPLPPAVEIHVIPALFDVMYPKPVAH